MGEYVINTTVNEPGGIVIIGGFLLLLVSLFNKIKNRKSSKQKLYLVNQVIDKTMIQNYIKKKNSLFRELTTKDYYKIIGVEEDKTFDMIYEAYKQKLKRYELKTLDVNYFPDLVKEEALRNIALLEYSFRKIQEMKRKK